jgi:subtilase family protein
MRIPVLTILSSQEPLMESAMAFKEGRAAKFPITAAKTPSRLEIDPTTPAIPIASQAPGGVATATAQPDQSSSFAVRAFLEAETPEDIPAEVDGVPVFSDPKIAAFPVTCGGAGIGNSATVAAKLRVAQLAARGLDGTNVAIAIMDTGINLAHLAGIPGLAPRLDAANSWTPPRGTTSPGRYPVDHGTMCAFDALIAAPNATLLDYPMLSSSIPGGNLTGSSLNAALQAFSHLLANWAVAFAPGGPQRYSALVVNNSWGIYHPSWDFPPNHPGRYCDNPNHPFHVIAAALTNSGADILFAAGNCGSDCPDRRCQGRTSGTIMGANAYQEVLTLAGCDTNDQRVGYSSQGPSIPGMFGDKPDLTSYTHFLGSQAFGPGSPDSGTSAACPVAAGCVAALRTKLPHGTTPPSNLFAQLRATAIAVGGQTAWNGDYGHGILDPIGAANSLGL